MPSVLDYRYTINGVISTEKTVLENIETLCSAAGSWLSYDVNDGLWSVVINNASNSVASFGDNNILGPIAVSSTGLTELYNSIKVEFPHVDLKDNLDYVTLTIPNEDRNTNEPNNELTIQFDCLNDPVQAEYLAFVELKQNRLDQVIKFTTDFSKIGLKAGDVIDVTNDVYGYTNKLFRIVSISENDGDDETITIDITALEFDANVYSTDDLYRYNRTDSTGITTIGAIGVPGTPQITKFESNARPHVLIESTSPTGIVEGMEFWYSGDANVALDSNRTYTLLGTTTPTLGNTFAFGTTVELDYDKDLPGNVYIKTRGYNSETTGPFSTTANLTYSPVQTAGAITNDTAVLDDSGNSLLGLLGASALMDLLGGLFAGNTSKGGSWANALGAAQAGVSSISAGSGISITSSTGAVTIAATGGGGTANIAAGTGINITTANGVSTINSTELWQGARKYVQSTTPTGTINSGDVWFKI